MVMEGLPDTLLTHCGGIHGDPMTTECPTPQNPSHWKPVEREQGTYLHVLYQGRGGREVDCTQSLSFLIHSNSETGASERYTAVPRMDRGGEKILFSSLFAILHAAVYLTHPSLTWLCISKFLNY